MRVDPDPSTLSVHEAQASVYADPWATVSDEAPERVTRGAVVSHEMIVTVTVPVLENAHAVSVIRYVKVSTPQNVEFAV